MMKTKAVFVNFIKHINIPSFGRFLAPLRYASEPSSIRVGFFLFLSTSFACLAQVEPTVSVGVGGSSLYDTYLSPLHYKGTEFRVMFQSEHWDVQAYLSPSKSRPTGNSSELNAMVMADYSWHYRWQPSPHIRLAAGGKAEVFMGGTYNTRNGNNPAQFRLGMDIAPSARAFYDFRLFKKQFSLSYQASLPLMGVQFSPRYGQSYYEIFAKDNYDYNACFTAPWNSLSYTHQLSLQIPISDHYLSIGYMGDYRQYKLNDLKYHNFSHLAVIGWTL